MIAALKLFAKDGYEAVSVSKIAGELGITKGALYKHYKNKRAIFDSIFERICRLDLEHSKSSSLPTTDFDTDPQKFGETSIENMTKFIKAQFKFWIEDEFACNFRKMLILEQYRTSEMTELYQKVFSRGPLKYIEDLFREMIKQGTCRDGDPMKMAVEFYSPFYLLLSISDGISDQQEKIYIFKIFTEYIDNFVEKYAVNRD